MSKDDEKKDIKFIPGEDDSKTWSIYDSDYKEKMKKLGKDENSTAPVSPVALFVVLLFVILGSITITAGLFEIIVEEPRSLIILGPVIALGGYFLSRGKDVDTDRS